MSSIVMIHTGGLGDFLQTLPVLAGLRETRPQANIVLVGHTSRASLAVAGGLADEVIEFETSGLHRLFQADVSADAVPVALREADFILDFLGHETFARNLARRTRATVVSARSFPAPGETRLAAAQFVYDQLAGPLGLPARQAVPVLRLSAARHETGTPAATTPDIGSAVAIHPGSGSPKKNWPLDRFRELARRLAADGLDTTWLLGPAETESAAFALPAGERHIAGADLREVAVVLGRARCYVGNDSGITHLAAALGTPTVALFGPTDPRVWAPRGDHVRVVAASDGDIGQIGANEVSRAVQSLLGHSRVPMTKLCGPA